MEPLELKDLELIRLVLASFVRMKEGYGETDDPLFEKAKSTLAKVAKLEKQAKSEVAV